MIGYRSFRNGDLPQLAEIWRTRSGLRGYAQPMSSALLETLVLSKPYFDREGLIVAVESDRLIGFAHAGFGPTEAEDAICHDFGASILTIAVPRDDELTIAKELIARSESYLTSRGAKVLYGGGIRPLNAFYIGLYGGSELPGILDTDPQQQAAFRSAGYREIDRTVVLHCELSSFRAPIDRKQMLVRRRSRIENIYDPPSRTWWEACTLGAFGRIEFRLHVQGEVEPAATATFVDMEAFSHTWGVRTAGLVELVVSESQRRQGIATCLLSDVLRQLADQGFGLVEAQTMQHNAPALAMYRKLGFHQIDSGAVFRKE